MTRAPSAADLLDQGLSRLAELNAMERLFDHDASLWTKDPGETAVILDRLGWLDAPNAFALQIEDLTAFAESVFDDGLDRVLLCGMGGSSLAPEVIAKILPAGERSAELRVLDSTHPAEVAAATAWADPRRTLFLIASKSGGTLETDCLRRHVQAICRDVLGDEVAPSRWVAITDPGSNLAERAETEGWRRTFLNPADVGGRFSALTYFGLVPAALHGVDLERFLGGAIEERDACRLGQAHGAVQLGAAIGAAASGHDRLQLRFSRSWAPLAVWVEQLVAESTGKQGRGSLPIAREPRKDDTERDVVMDLRRTDQRDRACEPHLDWTVNDPLALGRLFYRFEIATALGSALIGVEPFDQPNVTEAKAATKAVLAGETGDAPRVVAEDDALRIEIPSGSTAEVQGDTPEDVLRSFVEGGSSGDYVAFLAFLAPTEDVDSELVRLRRMVPADRSSTAGYGPRYLHSTGQYHKGGPACGRFVFLEDDADPRDEGPGPVVPIPGTDWTFGRVVAAQCEGDVRALAARGLPVLRIRRKS